MAGVRLKMPQKKEVIVLLLPLFNVPSSNIAFAPKNGSHRRFAVNAVKIGILRDFETAIFESKDREVLPAVFKSPLIKAVVKSTLSKMRSFLHSNLRPLLNNNFAHRDENCCGKQPIFPVFFWAGPVINPAQTRYKLRKVLNPDQLQILQRAHMCMYMYVCMYIYINIYIYIYAVKFLSGPSLAILGVIIWAK